MMPKTDPFNVRLTPEMQERIIAVIDPAVQPTSALVCIAKGKA